jgi:tetratricopeptide (TPR) repeat protein
MEGAAVLREVPGDLGGLLWQTLRTVTLWASAAPADRASLFTPGAAEARRREADAVPGAEALRGPLDRVATVLAAPADADREAVARACEELARWAGAQEKPGTRLAFTHAAALASPANAGRALDAGRLARDAGEYVLAEGWFLCAVGIARTAGDWDAYARAYVGLAKMWIRRGRHPLARRALDRAVRVAGRKGLREVHGMALHDRFTLEVLARNPAAAVRNAAAAARMYGPDHADLPRLAYDLAYQWMENGNHASALPVLRALLPRFAGRERMVAQGGMARAAGALGMAELHADAARAVLGAPDEYSNKAAVLLEVARGAADLGDVRAAGQALDGAVALAGRYGESRVKFEAEALAESLRAGEDRQRATASEWEEEPEGRVSRDLVALLEAAPAA